METSRSATRTSPSGSATRPRRTTVRSHRRWPSRSHTAQKVCGIPAMRTVPAHSISSGP